MAKVLFTDFFGVIVKDSGNSWLKEHNLYHRKGEVFPLGDIGEISEIEVFNRLSKMSGEDPKDIFEHFERLAILNEKTVFSLREIKKRGYKIVVLSNCYDSVLERRIKQFNLEDIFDDVIISYQVKMIKPNKDIFEYAYNKHCKSDDEVYFMDDMENNLVAPKALGWNVLHFNENIDLLDFFKQGEKIMLGNFTFCNTTRVHFGKDAINKLNEELPSFGKNVTLVYGGGSIKKNGIYDKVIEILKANGKVISEISGVMPNPTLDKLYEGIKIAREAKTDLILAVGGGSVIDYSKALGASINEEEDPWVKYFERFENPTCKVVPVASILTMVGTGSEMNGGSVITNKAKGLKVGNVFRHIDSLPKFSIMDPTYSFSIPHYQMVSGIYDIFNHICEQYFSNTDDNTSDYLAEALMKSLIVSSRIANVNPLDYEARSNIMWTSTWALNGLIGKGKAQDWNVHNLGQAIGAITDAAHGMTLAVVSLPYYKWVMPYGLDKFVRFATNVWNVSVDGKSKEDIANEGLRAMESWMKELGIVLDGRELGMTEENLDAIINATELSDAGYRGLKSKEEIKEILIKSMK